jgi:hypothetical protein
MSKPCHVCGAEGALFDHTAGCPVGKPAVLHFDGFTVSLTALGKEAAALVPKTPNVIDQLKMLGQYEKAEEVATKLQLLLSGPLVAFVAPRIGDDLEYRLDDIFGEHPLRIFHEGP